MADLGKVVVTDGGTYSASVTYEKLTFVHYNNDAYLTLKTVKGVTPTDDGVNYRLFCKSAATATTSKAGIVMPDGTTIGISNGKITAKTATQTTVGVVKGSNDINVGKDGALSLNTKFEQATALANIVAGEALKVVLGKVSKAIATTMNLDENALLKNMISGIDVNDGNKVPSSAYIHSLVERIGMGTAIEGGFDNLTAGLNSVNNNLSNFHFYNDLSQLGLSEGASINNLLEKMPAPSVGVFYCLSKSITGLPFDTQCVVTIFKNGNPFRIEVQDIWSGRTYVAIYSGGTVGKFVEYALKSDLQSNLLYKEFTTESRSWKTLECHRLSYTAPNGYKFLTICYTRTNGWIGATYVVPVIGSFDFDIYVPTGSGNGTVTLGALFVKNV